MKILSGKEIKPLLEAEIQKELTNIDLSFYLYSDPDNLDCRAYLNSIKRTLTRFSIPFFEGFYQKDLSEEENLSIFRSEIQNHAVLIARPLNIKSENEFIESIPSLQDPDMLTTINRGKLFGGDLSFLPATASSVMQILSHYDICLNNIKATVIGRSLSVGLPVFELLQKKNATVSLLHSKTKKEIFEQEVKQSTLLVLATGKPGLISKELLDSSKIIIDCGYASGSGDLGFQPKEEQAFAYTPVPGGVGPLTSLCLLLNAIHLKEKQ